MLPPNTVHLTTGDYIGIAAWCVCAFIVLFLARRGTK